MRRVITLTPGPFESCCHCGHGHEVRKVYKETTLKTHVAPGMNCIATSTPFALRDGPLYDRLC